MKKKNFNRARARRLLATTMLAGLASSPMVPGAALAQTADQPAAASAGTTPLPPVDVNGNQGGTGCGLYGGAPCSGYGGAGPAQDPYNTVLRPARRQHRHQDRYADHGHAAQRSGDPPAGAAGSAGRHPRPGLAECQRRDGFAKARSAMATHSTPSSCAVFRPPISTATGSGWTAEVTPCRPPPPPCNWPMWRASRCSKARRPFFTGSQSRAASSIS